MDLKIKKGDKLKLVKTLNSRYFYPDGRLKFTELIDYQYFEVDKHKPYPDKINCSFCEGEFILKDGSRSKTYNVNYRENKDFGIEVELYDLIKIEDIISNLDKLESKYNV